MRNPNQTSRRAGYSLTELLMAMGLFSLLGIGLVALLSRASDFLTTGQSGAETLDALQTFTESFSADVETLYTRADTDGVMPDVRMYADHVDCDVNGDEQPNARIQRLFFTRLIPREATSPMTRAAGTVVGAEGVLDQADDAVEADEGKLRATGGLMEVFWTAVPDRADDPAVMTLYRGFRSPIGGEGSLLPLGAANDPGLLGDVKGAQSRAQVADVARPILSGVLYFGVQFWSRKTRTWDEDEVPRNGGPLHTWDSTRGIMGPIGRGSRYDGFYFAKGEESVSDPTDDTYPRRMRVTLVVEQVGNNAAVGFLAADLSADANYVELQDARFVPAADTTKRYIKIGAEWIQFVGMEGNTLTGCVRGARGTQPTAHESGSIVHHGRTVVREYSIAAFRDTYQDDLPALTGR
jgi:hypothetical protein